MCECDCTYVNIECGVVDGELFCVVYFSSVEFYFI